MNRRTQSILLAAMGLVGLGLATGGQALTFVRPALVPYLFVAGAVLLLLAVAPAPRTVLLEEGDGHGHGWRAPWLVLVPILVLLVVAPGPLGASAAGSAQRAVAPQTDSAYPPVGPRVGGAVPMTLAEYTSRAVDDDAHSLTGVPVRLTGFVAKAKDGKGFLLSRFTIFCCAADAEIEQIRVTGGGSGGSEDTWVTVTGTWPPGSTTTGSGADAAPQLRATSVVPVSRPRAPYEYTLQFAV